MAARVAGGARLTHGDEQRIIVAVRTDGENLLGMTGGFALVPKLLARTAVKPSIPCFHRFGKRFQVHISEHEHLIRALFDDDCRNELRFYKIF